MTVRAPRGTGSPPGITGIDAARSVPLASVEAKQGSNFIAIRRERAKASGNALVGNVLVHVIGQHTLVGARTAAVLQQIAATLHPGIPDQ